MDAQLRELLENWERESIELQSNLQDCDVGQAVYTAEDLGQLSRQVKQGLLANIQKSLEQRRGAAPLQDALREYMNFLGKESQSRIYALEEFERRCPITPGRRLDLEERLGRNGKNGANGQVPRSTM